MGGREDSGGVSKMGSRVRVKAEIDYLEIKTAVRDAIGRATNRRLGDCSQSHGRFLGYGFWYSIRRCRTWTGGDVAQQKRAFDALTKG